MDYNSTLEKLKSIGQEHLLRFYDELDDKDKAKLLNQINTTDIDGILKLYQDLVINHPQLEADEIKPIKSTHINSLSDSEKNRLRDIGLDLISRGKVAAFLVAGGQGSRLGFDGPKGAYDVGLPSHKSLFEIQADGLSSLHKETGFSIPWYIMTSPSNNDYTVNFFKEHNYFGLNKEDIKFFMQEQIPSVDSNGKIILSSKSDISLNPNGSGGCFLALRDNGLLDDMIKRGIEYIFFYGVDNILVKMADPILIGFAKENDKDITSKSVAKVNPSEKVGVFAYRNGKPSIVEYTELPEEMSQMRDEDGSLLFKSGNINAMVFKIDFLKRALNYKPKYHVAFKKIKFITKNGDLISPEKENAYKFEGHYFDYFEHADDMAILDINRDEEFAPVKNLTGVDSAETAREMYLKIHNK